jgi:hypothetical protein
MYFDLFVPFPIPAAQLETFKKKKDKGKGKAPAEALGTGSKSPWDGLTSTEKDAFSRSVALSGHRQFGSSSDYPSHSVCAQHPSGRCSNDPLPRIRCFWQLLQAGRSAVSFVEADDSQVGYSVVACTLSHEPSPHAKPLPFRSGLPYKNLDPRHRAEESSSGPTLVQVSRYHMRLDDSRTHCLVRPI